MSLIANHPLQTLRDGITGFSPGSDPRPVPLRHTAIVIEALSGLAVVTVRRAFRNAEAEPIEAVMTFPVPFDAVMTGLRAEVGGRSLVALGYPRAAARETYEAALDQGKTTILHEEALQGLHVLSVGQLGPGEDARVEAEFVMPMSPLAEGAGIRIPTTVGRLYGTSPFAPADDLETSTTVVHEASLRVLGTDAVISGVPLPAGHEVSLVLDHTIDLVFPACSFGTVMGRDATGHSVSVTLKPVPTGERRLGLSILFDHSGSMGQYLTRWSSRTKWSAAQSALASALNRMRPDDDVILRSFDNETKIVGRAKGAKAVELVSLLPVPDGGTDIGKAVESAIADDATQDILLITDGQTYASEVQDLARRGRRISAVLVGDDSLEAMVGHMTKMTGGQLFIGSAEALDQSMSRALASFRTVGGPSLGVLGQGGPQRVSCARGGVQIEATWHGTPTGVEGSDPVGRFAAALALPVMSEASATEFAIAHTLCTHLTSLLIVDEAGEAKPGLPNMRKIPLQEAAWAIRSDLSYFRDDRAASGALRASFSHRVLSLPPPTAQADEDILANRLSTPSFMDSGDHGKLDMDALAGSVDWARHTGALSRGDVSALDPDQIEAITWLSEQDKIREIATLLQIDRSLVAVGTLAMLSLSDRFAERLVRKLFARLSNEQLMELSDAAHSADWMTHTASPP